MALQLSIAESIVGVGFDSAYARVTNIFGNKTDLQVQIGIHANAAARVASAQEVRQEAFYIPTAELPANLQLLPAIYQWLKANVPMFAAAIDV
jgi:hypothetical protein